MASKANDPNRAALSVLSPPAYGDYEIDLEHMPACPDVASRQGWTLDAKLWFGRFTEGGRLADYHLRHFANRDRVRGEIRKLREVAKRVGLRESEIDWFAYGTGSVPAFASGDSALTRTYLPLLPGPATRQQYWADYFATSAKAFEAYHHDPIIHRSVHLTTQFTLGRGVEATVKGQRGQDAWDLFWKRNRMDERLPEIDRDLTIFGEQFIRYFPMGDTLVVRSLDPATIYEVVTDQEDRETVYFYHQQFTTRTELFAPQAGYGGAPQGPTTGGNVKYVVRQIPASEIDHIRINAVSSEVRGRSDLFSSLGYVKRLRDLMTSRVIKADMESRMVFLLKADGSQSDITALRNALFPGGKPPNPGTVVALNQAADLSAFVFNAAAESGIGADIDALINLVAVGLGVPKEYLGITGGRGQTRANALVATEPAAKRFEDRQSTEEHLLHRMANRLFDYLGFTGDDRAIEFTFPSIVTEDRTAKLKDVAFAEAQGYISKKTGATIAAKELGISTYDFEEEQGIIAEEFADASEGSTDGESKVRRPYAHKDYVSILQPDPTKAIPEIPELPAGTQLGNETPAPGGETPTPEGKTRGGFPASQNPGSQAGAAAIRKENTGSSNSLSEAAVERLLIVTTREVARAVRAARRRPDDPAFEEHAAEYRERSAANLRDLVTSAVPNGAGGGAE